MWGLAAMLALGVALVGCKGGSPENQEKSKAGDGGNAQKADAAQATPSVPDVDYVAPGTQLALDRGIAYLKKAQLEDGGWAMKPADNKSDLSATTVVSYALLNAGVPATDPAVVKAVDYIVKFAQEDGGIYANTGLNNYTTSISLMVLKAAGTEKNKAVVDKALTFLKNLQWDGGEGLELESADFGGAGYGTHNRPDLSNTAWFVETMNKMGVGKDDPALKNAVIFISRLQAGEAAKGYWVSDGSGGFIYAMRKEGDQPATGESKAGTITLPSGGKGLKCYGSMSYAGFLSLIYAGLERNDPRVKAAYDWMQNNWTVEENPEMGLKGYYYYLMTMGKALRAYGSPTIIDEQGNTHSWRQELSKKYVSMQKQDGSWANSDPGWMEDSPTLATSFALVGLHACKAKL
jgi:squalene-hopene/tetraprenyl-beta-curcumene cyclase